MVVVRIWGGIGNQLSLFCVGYIVSQYLRQPLCLDISYHKNGYFRPYILDLLSLQEFPKMIYPISDQKMKQDLRQNYDLKINLDYVRQKEDLLFLCKGHKNVYIYGDCSTRFYRTEDIINLKNWFHLRYESPYFCNMCELLSNSESVAVHIRRTDMVDLNWVHDKAEIYYKAAISYIKSKLVDPVIYFFSDDIQWVYKVFGIHENFYYVNFIGGAITDVEELFLMAACKHHILTAKSTYSWWATFLSPWLDGVNISDGEMMPCISRPNIICFDSMQIERWYGKYLADEVQMEREDTYLLKDERVLQQNGGVRSIDNIETLMNQGKYKAAIQQIDNLSISRVSMSSDLYYKLLELKTWAFIQEICSGSEHAKDIHIGETLSMMDELLPERKGDFDFYYKFSLALFIAGRVYESVLYAANAKRIEDRVQTFWWIDSNMQELFSELYKKLLREQKTHFVFLNIIPWDNMRCFYDSLEIILSNLGFQVTILECFKDDSRQISSWEEVLKSRKLLDSVNNYGIQKFVMHCTKEEEYFFYAKDLIDTITEADKEIKIVTHFFEGVRTAPYPVYFIDGYSKWDRLKYITDKYDKKTMDLIGSLSVKLFTDRFNESVWSKKVVNSFDTRLVQESYNIFDQYEKDYLNFDCYVRNQNVMQEILRVILNI